MTNEERIDWLCRLRTDIANGIIFTPWKDEFIEALNGVVEEPSVQSYEDTEPQKIHEWEIRGKRAELWIVKGKLQIRALGTIHNVSLPLVQTCGDAVSREAVKKLYCNICMDKNICYRNKENCEELALFDKLPPVQPESRWIPISERLPEPQDGEDKDYSVTVQVTIHVCRNIDIVRGAYYCFSESKWYTEGLCIGKVTAWMPKPVPYKEGK